MNLDYPKKLPFHQIKTFNDSNTFNLSAFQYVKAYNHRFAPFRCAKEPTHAVTLGNTLPMHSHNFYEINIVTKGIGMHYIGNNRYETTVGDVFIIPPYVTHGYFSHDEFQIYHMLISHMFLSTFHNVLDKAPGYYYMFAIEPYFRSDSKLNMAINLSADSLLNILSLLNRLNAYNHSENHDRFLENTLALNIIAELLHEAKKTILSLKQKKDTGIAITIANAMEYINANYETKISFTELAESCKMSYSTFFRNFTQYCKTTPSKYLLQCRIENAIRELLHTDKPITEIAISCGFYDSSNFIKTFEKVKKVSPSNFRDSIKNNT